MRKFSECCGAYSEDEDDGPEFDSAGYSIADR